MKHGIGEIHLVFAADTPGGDVSHRVVLEHHHQRSIAVYLVNGLIPNDPAIRITAQSRNENQSLYQLDFDQGPAYAARGWSDPSPLP